MIYENKLPYAHRSQNFKYLLENEVGKTLQEVCSDKANRKAAKDAALYQLQKLANKLLTEITNHVKEFRRGELDIVSLMEKMEQLRDHYKNKANDENIRPYVSQHEIQLIWNNTLKREKQYWWK